MRKNRNEVYEDIPASLELAITGCTITDRGITEGEDGEMIRRVMILWAGESLAVAWHHSDAETTKRLLAGWPSLTQGQLLAAMRMLRGRINAELKAAAATKPRTGWTSWRPLRDIIYGDDDDE